MRQRAARGLDAADALGRRRGGQHAVVADVISRIGRQFHPALGGVEQLDQPRPVGGQAVVDRFAAQRFVELLVLGLRQRRGHAVGGVQPRQRRGLVDARILAVDEALPADLLEVRELEVGPRLDALGDVVAVVRGPYLAMRLPSGSTTRILPS